tara:strand:- start:1004 stop:1261 length:258 start_codon:yes stop_codon:yes gene_type:complete
MEIDMTYEAKTLILEEIELDNFGFPGVMIMECEVDIDLDNAGDWYVRAILLGGKRTIPDLEKAIMTAIYDTPRTCDYIIGEIKGE